MIGGFPALAVIAGRAERLQVMRGQPQIPVIRERLDVIDIHARAVACRAAAQHAGRLLRQVRIAQSFPFRRLVKPLHQARLCALAADEGPHQPGGRREDQRNQFAER